MRRVQVSRLTNDKWMTAEWFDIEYENLKEGDIFRLFEPDGTSVVNGYCDMWIATSDAYYNEETETWEVKFIDIPH